MIESRDRSKNLPTILDSKTAPVGLNTDASILHIVPSLENLSSGPAYSVPALCRGLAILGTKVEILSLGTPLDTRRDGYRDRRFRNNLPWHPLKKLGNSSSMKDALFATQSLLFHAHGLWMMPTVYPAMAAKACSVPFILSPRGMLGAEALKFSRWKKRVFQYSVQRTALEAVRCFHATAEQEYEEIRTFGLKQPVAVIPNGVDIPPWDPHVAQGRDNEVRARPYVLSLGRIHPKKGLKDLILAWKELEQLFPEWELRIVGPNENGHLEELVSLSNRLQLKNVKFEGPVFGTAKLQLLQRAELFALPTRNENFAMVVAESLSVGTPVISTRGAPWAGLLENRCGWWVDIGTKAIAAGLREAMSCDPVQRRSMGVRGRVWMERDFGWLEVSRKMLHTYHWMLSPAEKPDWIRVR